MGGQSIPNFDRYLAKGVSKTYITSVCKVIDNRESLSERDINKVKSELRSYIEDNVSILDEDGGSFVSLTLGKYNLSELEISKIMAKALKSSDKSTYQAMESLIHNLNTMHSRAGAQVPFSSINYGTDTSPEGRMVTKNLLLSIEAGLGNGETAIFPISIFKVKEGINYNEGDPNYDLFKLACRVSAKRLFPKQKLGLYTEMYIEKFSELLYGRCVA